MTRISRQAWNKAVHNSASTRFRRKFHYLLLLFNLFLYTTVNYSSISKDMATASIVLTVVDPELFYHVGSGTGSIPLYRYSGLS
jgi:hypothetical protein